MTLLSPKKDLRTLTNLEREKEVAKQRIEQEELIDEMGQDSELKALSTVRAYVKELQELEKKNQAQSLEILEHLRKNPKRYFRYLITVLYRFIQEEDIPKKYELYVDSSDDGIAIGITGTQYVSGFAPCGNPMYDLNACKMLSVRLGNTVGKLEGNLEQTDGGILIGNKQEIALAMEGVKRYGRSRKPKS